MLSFTKTTTYTLDLSDCDSALNLKNSAIAINIYSDHVKLKFIAVQMPYNKTIEKEFVLNLNKLTSYEDLIVRTLSQTRESVELDWVFKILMMIVKRNQDWFSANLSEIYDLYLLWHE